MVDPKTKKLYFIFLIEPFCHLVLIFWLVIWIKNTWCLILTHILEKIYFSLVMQLIFYLKLSAGILVRHWSPIYLKFQTKCITVSTPSIPKCTDPFENFFLVIWFYLTKGKFCMKNFKYNFLELTNHFLIVYQKLHTVQAYFVLYQSTSMRTISRLYNQYLYYIIDEDII